MIKYGAQEIILAENDGMLEQNIDSIIDYSMQKTNEIKQELSKLEMTGTPKLIRLFTPSKAMTTNANNRQKVTS